MKTKVDTISKRTKKFVAPFIKHAVILTNQQAELLGITEQDIERGRKKMQVKYASPFGGVLSIRGIVMNRNFGSAVVTMWTERTLTQFKELGYEAEGYASVDGKRVRVFTTSSVFQVAGKLVSVDHLFAVI
jgi:hypothetical protein